MRQNRKTMVAILVAVVALMIVMMTLSAKLNTQIEAGNAQISDLQTKQEAEEQRTDDIRSLKDEMQSDEYKEQIAKEKLGLIKDNEIIFKESDSDE
ncbi:MAG: septum formation initiator family protein [Eubacteriales bacterium]|jgi:cell division protein DivIC